MSCIIEHDVTPCHQLPPGYRVHAVLTLDDEVRYTWEAPGRVTPGVNYRTSDHAGMGAWTDFECASKTEESYMSNAFSLWIDTFISEKGIDAEQTITVSGASGPNVMPLSAVLEAIKRAPVSEQADIKRCLVKIDYLNADPVRFLTHLAHAIAV